MHTLNLHVVIVRGAADVGAAEETENTRCDERATHGPEQACQQPHGVSIHTH